LIFVEIGGTTVSEAGFGVGAGDEVVTGVETFLLVAC
jgi:hypothetical protein